MPLVKLEIPSGIYRNGTDLQSSGRWRDSNLIRWIDNTMRPMGGWRIRSNSASTAPVRGMLSWVDNNNNRWVAGGAYNKLYVWNAGGARFDITPTSFTSGRIDALALIGYGNGNYNSYAYGVARQDTARILPATSWSLDTWGQNLVGCTEDDGKLYEWALGTSTPAAVIANAPVDNRSLIVTEERFLFALGAGGNLRKVQWSDREDNTSWTPAATNEAGDLELDTSGQIMKGVKVRGQTLILTSTDAHVANYIGPPYVYGIERVGSSCGLAAKEAVAVVDSGAFWMGAHSFYAYTGGAVREIQSEVSDYVFNDMNRGQVSKTFAVTNSNFGEILWFYPSGSSTENDRYVVFNYIENTWYIGSLGRTAGVDAGIFKKPMWVSADDYKIYDHEVGFNYGTLTPFAETGPIMLGSGDTVASVTEMLPDEKTQGDVDVTFKTRFYPNGTERDYGPYSMSNPTSLRFTGRQMRMRVSAARLGDWRIGVNRLDISPGGRR
jgi:hypothetical protein